MHEGQHRSCGDDIAAGSRTRGTEPRHVRSPHDTAILPAAGFHGHRAPRKSHRHRVAVTTVSALAVTATALGTLAVLSPAGSQPLPVRAQAAPDARAAHESRVRDARNEILRYRAHLAPHSPRRLQERRRALPGTPWGLVLGCSALESLWRSAGGSVQAEATAADVAVLESGNPSTGLAYASATGAAGEEGFWQVNPVNDGLVVGGFTVEASHDPEANARDAVALSRDGTDWSAWTTYTSGAYLSAGCPAGQAQDYSASLLSRSKAPKRLRALRYAESFRGRRYCWGGTGPSCFDCSGLVYRAYRHEGYAIPRTTTGMLGWWRLRRVRSPKRGDLAFYGSGHVELVTKFPHVTFGAHDSGTRVGFIRWGGSWAPTAFFMVGGAG